MNPNMSFMDSVFGSMQPDGSFRGPANPGGGINPGLGQFQTTHFARGLRRANTPAAFGYDSWAPWSKYRGNSMESAYGQSFQMPAPPIGGGAPEIPNQPQDYMQAQMNMPNYEQRIVGMSGVPGLQSQLDILNQMGLGGLLG